MHYHAVNEPICMYASGTNERAQLDAALKRFNSEVQDVPIVIGDEEIRSGEARLQPKVSALLFNAIEKCAFNLHFTFNKHFMQLCWCNVL